MCDRAGHTLALDERLRTRDNPRMDRERYVPALRFDVLTRFFDPVVRLTTRERRFKKLLVEQVDLRPRQRVIDVGCGTATLLIALKRACPTAEVIGLDGDPRALDIARNKISAASVSIELIEQMAWQLPFPDASLDRVVSSLVFHHLGRETKLRTLREMHRVLAPDGELHIADWGRPHGLGMRAAFLAVQLLDGFTTTSDSVAGTFPRLIVEAGFVGVQETQRLRTPLGTLALYRASRASPVDAPGHYSPTPD